MRVIFYSSGTGNSLSVAKKIADSLPNTDLVRIDFTKLQKRVSIESYEQVGIVFPIYSYHMQKAAEKSYQSYSETATHFCVTNGCTHCGMCQKVCPANNIMIHNGSPTWGENCEACMACIQWCPSNSIHYGKKTIAKKRYHHPEVTLGQMKL